MSLIDVTDHDFDAVVLQAGRPVLVDFWGEGCSPCRDIIPRLEEIASEMADHIVVAKLNVDKNPVTAERYGVRGVPTLAVFSHGQLSAIKVGAWPKPQLLAWLKESLGKIDDGLDPHTLNSLGT